MATSVFVSTKLLFDLRCWYFKQEFNPLRFNPGKAGIFFTPRKRSTRAKPGFFLPPANVQPGQNRDFTDPVEGLPFDAQKPYEGW